MKTLNKDTNITNEIALKCKVDNKANERLFWAVEGLLRKELAKYNIHFDQELGFAYECLTLALDNWVPERGDFALALYYTAGAKCQRYWTVEAGPITLSQYGKNKNGGGMEFVRDTADNWDSVFGYADDDGNSQSFKSDMQKFRNTLDTPGEIIYFDLFYMQGEDWSYIRETTPLSTNAKIQYVAKKLKPKLTKFLERRDA